MHWPCNTDSYSGASSLSDMMAPTWRSYVALAVLIASLACATNSPGSPDAGRASLFLCMTSQRPNVSWIKVPNASALGGTILVMLQRLRLLTSHWRLHRL